MKNIILVLLCACLVIKINAQSPCPNLFKCGDTLVDARDSFKYPTVQIGTQCWLGVSLQAKKYLNGDAIPNVTNSTWTTLTTGAWCDYQNTASNGANYGHMYNWYSTKDNRGLCPKDWYVPTENEWLILVNYLGGAATAG